jgi:hypothetical protein
MAKAQIDYAIRKRGVSFVNAAKIPADRSIAEVHTMGAIRKGVELTPTTVNFQEVELTRPHSILRQTIPTQCSRPASQP